MATNRAPGSGFLPAQPRDCGFLGYKCWGGDAVKWLWNETKQLWEEDMSDRPPQVIVDGGVTYTAEEWSERMDPWRAFQLGETRSYSPTGDRTVTHPDVLTFEDGSVQIGRSTGVWVDSATGGNDPAWRQWVEDQGRRILGDLFNLAQDRTGYRVVPKQTFDAARIVLLIAAALIVWKLLRR